MSNPQFQNLRPCPTRGTWSENISIYTMSQEISYLEPIRNIFTCWIYIENTRILLHADFILSPTQQSSIVQFGHRGVSSSTACLFGGDVTRRYVDGLRAVVELPDELHVGGIRLQLARDANDLLARRPVHLLLTRSTHRRV